MNYYSFMSNPHRSPDPCELLLIMSNPHRSPQPCKLLLIMSSPHRSPHPVNYYSLCLTHIDHQTL
uniref:Uncharacterized protein n=1 Tax=Anguilla anguilla TaxID=7936 RepID=A0A0E9PKE5_ANGAN